MVHLPKPKHNHPAETRDCDSSERRDRAALVSWAVIGQEKFIDTGRCHMLDEDTSVMEDNAGLLSVCST